MIPISDDLKTAFSKTTLQELKGYLNLDGSFVEIIGNKDIMNGGFAIARDTISGNSIEIGTAIASEVTIKLLNYEHSFETKLAGNLSNFVEGAELYFTLSPHGSNEAMPLGYFIIDEITFRQNFITVKGMDRMVLFDREVSSESAGAGSMYNYIQRACTDCGVELATPVSEITQLPNWTIPVAVQISSHDSISYRQMIMWACQIMGVNAYIDWDGKLRLEYYPHITDTAISIDKSNRTSSDIMRSDIEVTGIIYVDSDGNEYIGGTDAYAISFSDNRIIDILGTGFMSTIPTNVYNYLYLNHSSVKYLPFSANILNMPWLMPMDRVKLVDYNGETRDSFITNLTFKLNGTLTIEARGTSATKFSYSTTGAFTSSQQKIINNVDGLIEEKIKELVPSAQKNYEVTIPAGGLMTYVNLSNGAMPKSVCAIGSGEMVILDMSISDGKMIFQISESVDYDIVIRGELTE